MDLIAMCFYFTIGWQWGWKGVDEKGVWRIEKHRESGF